MNHYRGLVVPVFTPFLSNGDVNYKEIPKYADFLARHNVNAVLVNGSVGEGALLSTEERINVLEEWCRVAKHTGQKVMVHVGATNLTNVLQLTKHAATLHQEKNSPLWSILCLPDLLFRPNTCDKAVSYLEKVAAAAPQIPIFYYHYPVLTGVRINMLELMEKAGNQIPNFAGLKFTHNDLDECIRCVELQQRRFTIFFANDQLFSAAFFLGTDSAMLSTLNVIPDQIQKAVESASQGRNEEARCIQQLITQLVYKVLDNGMEFGSGLKYIISRTSKIDLGESRAPLQKISREQMALLDDHLKKMQLV